jgi:hypothetical protein
LERDIGPLIAQVIEFRGIEIQEHFGTRPDFSDRAKEAHIMSRTLTRFILATSSILAFTFLLTPAGRFGAQGRGPNSLQPDSSAVFFTMVLQRNQPVSRGNFLILPSPNSHASINAKGGTSGGGGGHKGGGGSGGGTGGGGTGTCCGGSLTLTPVSSTYSVTNTGTITPPVETPTTTQPEAEEEIAVDPTTPGNLVAAISDFSRSNGFNTTKWALSTDNGSTWIESFVPSDPISGQLVTSDNAIWDANSDPVVAIDNNQNVFLSDLYLKLDSSGRIIAEGLYVSTATLDQLNSTGTFANSQTNNPNTYVVMTNLNNGSTFNIEDKPWITVDNSGTAKKGTVYASWSHFTGCQNQYSALYGGYVLTCSSDSIYLSYSTNHGVTWTSPVQISPSTQNGAVQGSQPAVGSDGTVYVTYEFFGSNNQRQQNLAVGTWSSTGLTFSTPFPASPVFYELGFAGCNTCSASYRVNSFPNIAVSPAGATGAGNVYLAYGAQTSNTSLAQVNFMACTASCTSSNAFYGPGNISENANQEAFFPAIAVASDGVIHTSWFDTRNSPTSPTNPDYLDVYASYLNYDPTSNAFTVSQNARVTPTTNNASYPALPGWGDTSFIGDYIGIAAAGGTAHPVWTNVTGILGEPLSGSLQTRALPLSTSP